MLVSHREPLIDVLRRSGNEWLRVEARAGERVQLASIGCELQVDAVYEGLPLG